MQVWSRAVTLAGVLGVPGAAHADDWASLGLDGPRSRVSAERSGSAFGPARWEHTLPPVSDAVYRSLVASPALADGFLVYGTTRNVVRALRADDGRELWTFATKDAVFSSPAVARGWAYVVDTGRQLYALRLTDGGLVWKRDIGGIAYGSPALVEGSVFVTTGAPMALLHRFDAETGKLVWRAGEGVFRQAAYASATVAEGRVIVGEVRGRYHSFAVSDGAHQWTTETGGIVNMSSPLVLDGRVYLVPGGDNGQVHAVDIDTGKPVSGWPVDLPAPGPAAGALLARRHVVSSPAGLDGQFVLVHRIEDRMDSNADGLSDSIVLSESVVAIDAADGRVLWSQPNGRLVTEDPNRIPTYGLCPTPALYRGSSGQTLVAVASSLSPKLRVLELARGEERWSEELSAATRGSPALANGRLVLGTDAGVIHSFLSRTNQPPAAPGPQLAPFGGQDVDATSVTLRWGAGLDPEGESVSHEVRVDDDGEVLHDWDLATAMGTGQLSLDVTVQLAPGRLYTFAVRARDRNGAYSAWSLPGQFRAVMTPSVQVDGAPVPGLAAALGMARAGSTISLGAGVYPLSSTMRLPAGVSLAGVAPHLTTLLGKGLAVAVQAGSGNQIRQLAVTGATIGVQVTSGDDARLQNVVLRDNTDAGLDVRAGSGAHLVSATVARNGSGVRATGKVQVRNSIITANTVGIEATDASAVSSRYNDVFGNRTSDYEKAQRSETDRADVVTFGIGDEDLRLTKTQATTDKGDPADDFDSEPRPNGDRINLGAFGNTPFAELSDPALLPPSPPPGPEETPHTKTRSSGGGPCSLGSASGAPDGAVLFVLLALLLRRRRMSR